MLLCCNRHIIIPLLIVNEHQQIELKQIFSILSNRMKHIKGKQAKDIINNLSAIFIGIIIEALQTTYHVPSYSNKRQIAITLSFQKLLKVEYQINKRPSYYASRLNISSVYLNEVIKSVTGMNVSQFLWHKHIVIKNANACIGCKRCIKACNQLVISDSKSNNRSNGIYKDTVILAHSYPSL